MSFFSLYQPTVPAKRLVAASLAFAAQPVCTGPTDLGPSARYHQVDLTPPFVLEDGCLSVPAGLGIGVEPDPTTLDDCTVAVWRS